MTRAEALAALMLAREVTQRADELAATCTPETARRIDVMAEAAVYAIADILAGGR